MNYTIFTKTGLLFQTKKCEYSDRGVKFTDEENDEYFIPYENIDYVVK